MVERLSRNFVGLLFWIGIAAAALFVNFLVVTSNYLACKTSFELLNFEGFELGKDTLVGGVFEAFFARATLAQLYALTVALTVAGGLFLMFRLLFHTGELVSDRQAYKAAGDMTSAAIANHMILKNVVMVAVFAVPVGFAINWDIDLFRYRSVANAMNIDDAVEATRSLRSWSLQLKEHADLFAWSLARWGAWGYVGVTGLACLCLEVSLVKIRESWAKLLSAFDETDAALAAAPAPEFYGYDEQGLPVQDPRVPIAYDTAGNPVGLPATDATTAGGTTTRMKTPVVEDIHRADDLSDTNGQQLDQGLQTNVGEPWAALRTIDPARAAHGPTERFDVIGGRAGERVSLDEALAHPERFFVDPDSHEVWDVAYRAELLGEPTPGAPTGGMIP